MSYVSEQLEHLKKLNSNEPEFIQAATEVLTTLEPVIEANPQYEAAGVSPSRSARSCSACRGSTITARFM